LTNCENIFSHWNFRRKKNFIVNLKQKLEGKKSTAHESFLEECVRTYNAEVRARNKEAGFAPKPPPEISPDSFAKALATLIYGGAKSNVKSRLIGKWQRDPDDGDFYYTFNPDGSFETNEFDGDSPILIGNFTVSPDNVVLMEPHDKLKFTSLMFSQTGDSLIIAMKDGLSYEYKKRR
jgi:hypothetical protein